MATQTALHANDITQLGYVALQNYLKNKPIDQVATERPLLKALMAKKKPWGGGKENIVEQIRTGYGNNFEWFGDSALNTSSTVTYNTRDTVRQAYYPWNSAHDGFQFSEDYLLGNGILIGDSQSPRNSSAAGLVQLTNVFNEAMEVLRLGFEKILDQSLHLDGTIGVGGGTSLANKAINGLDFIVPCVSHTGTMGGIDRSANTYWRNQIDMGAGLNVTTGAAYGSGYDGADLLDPMQTMWRACQKNGGSPNFILAGTDFIKSYEIAVDAKLSRYAVQPGTAQSPWNLDASLEIKDSGTFTGLFFQGVPVIWDPVFEDLDGISGADESNGLTVAWSKRCYMLNLNHLTLRPIQDNDMIARKPPREHTSYNYYWGMTWRGALTANRCNCHGVIMATGS
tara:strand:+ start:4474 stop:5661 length:1188 start_codon:yes stop_codon:yes gene_type:complete